MTEQLTYIELAPVSSHRATIIWLHGLGADGHDFEGIAPELKLPTALGVRFIFPNAPIQPVTINGGMAMRAWYDIVENTLERQVDVEGINRSAALIEALIEQEVKAGIAQHNIIVAGFSQGGLIALHTGLRCQYALGGIIALSTYLPTLGQLETERTVVNYATPILMAHGRMDNIVPLSSGQSAYHALQAWDYPVEWRDYPMSHSVCQEQIQHIADFIKHCFAKAENA